MFVKIINYYEFCSAATDRDICACFNEHIYMYNEPRTWQLFRLSSKVLAPIDNTRNCNVVAQITVSPGQVSSINGLVIFRETTFKLSTIYLHILSYAFTDILGRCAVEKNKSEKNYPKKKLSKENCCIQ